jgi:tetratricopeptide (TPR) repeat protein
MPFVGHVMMSWLQKSGVLTQFIEGAFAESLTDFDCWLLARSRRKIARYYHMLGTLNKNPSTVKLCIYSILIIDEVPENFARIIFELTKLVGKSDDIDITTIPLKSRDDMAKNSVGKGYFYLAKRLSDLGDVEKSLKFSLKIIRYGGYHASILINVAECYIKLNTYELANFYANEAFNVCEKEELANVYRIKSRILLKLDKPLLALEMAKESVEIDYNMMGLKDCFNALLKTENFDEALSYAIIISDQFGDDTYLKKLKVKE